MEIISPMLDVMFKRMFSMNSSRLMLCDFLSAYIDFGNNELSDVILIDSELKRNSDEKKSIMDLRVQLNNVEVDVEIQLRSQKYFEERTVYYLSKMYSSQLDEGMSYAKIHRCISLCLIDFEKFKGSKFCRSILLRDEILWCLLIHLSWFMLSCLR